MQHHEGKGGGRTYMRKDGCSGQGRERQEIGLNLSRGGNWASGISNAVSSKPRTHRAAALLEMEGWDFGPRGGTGVHGSEMRCEFRPTGSVRGLRRHYLGQINSHTQQDTASSTRVWWSLKTHSSSFGSRYEGFNAKLQAESKAVLRN